MNPGRPLLTCFSHLRWNFVFQRPQHLLTRFAKIFDVIYVEEPYYEGVEAPRLDITEDPSGVTVAVPVFAWHDDVAERDNVQRKLLDGLLAERRSGELIVWYYTPMALGFSSHLRPALTIYDCMDELSGFRFAPPELRAREAGLLARADLVFTGGQSLYEAKRDKHPDVHAFPSSVDVAHFARARLALPAPVDQASIPHPRLGYFGVIDERMDFALLGGLAEQRPDWHLVMLGPVVKVDEADLPRLPNIHYLGGKDYVDLPDYLSGWDVALLPFALNEATRFISPTKTPEYLAAGKPVISTPIKDVVRPYGDMGLVAIATDESGFRTAAETFLQPHDRAGWLAKVDRFLAQQSWDRTWGQMRDLMLRRLAAKNDSLEERRPERALAI